jgi:hypothetical protein
MAILPKAIYMLNAISTKNQRDSSKRLKINPKVHLEAQKTTKSQGSTGQKEQC